MQFFSSHPIKNFCNDNNYNCGLNVTLLLSEANITWGIQSIPSMLSMYSQDGATKRSLAWWRQCLTDRLILTLSCRLSAVINQCRTIHSLYHWQ